MNVIFQLIMIIDNKINPHIETPEKITEEEINEIIKINNEINYNLDDTMENIEINKENEAAKTTTLEEANFFNNKFNLSVNHKDNIVNNFTNFTKSEVTNKDIDINKKKEDKKEFEQFSLFKQDEKCKRIITDLKIDAETNSFKYDNKEYYLYTPKNQRNCNKISLKCKIYRANENHLTGKKKNYVMDK